MRIVLLLSFGLFLEAVRLGLIECLVPGKGLELAAPGARGTWFEESWPVDHIDPGITQERDDAPESWVGGERAVDERQHDDGYAQAHCFSEDAQGEVVADAVGPFVSTEIKWDRETALAVIAGVAALAACRGQDATGKALSNQPRQSQ